VLCRKLGLLLPERRFSIPGRVKLPNAERAFVDIAKLRDYSLRPQHKEGAAQGLGLRVGTGSGRITIVPHPRKELPIDTTRSIIRQSGLTPLDFRF
jgi:hypothetical protein